MKEIVIREDYQNIYCSINASHILVIRWLITGEVDCGALMNEPQIKVTELHKGFTVHMSGTETEENCRKLF